MRRLYTTLAYFAIPFILLRLIWRARKNPAYRERWNERFGCFAAPEHTTPIWLHAVSLGEVNAAAPLIKALLQAYPERQITVTTTTPTGSARVKTLFGKAVFHVYLPYDFPDAIDRFITRIQPKILVIMETELWPNVITACHQKNIPVVITNARLSERSMRGYLHIQSMVQEMMGKITLISAQTEMDVKRFMQLGIPADRINRSGNLKFDIEIDPQIKEKAQQLREAWGVARPVWIVGSTHPGEDEKILAAYQTLKKHFAELLLILVPRHPERFEHVIELCNATRYKTAKRSEFSALNHHTDILVVNTIGELLTFYAAADIAFVAGSFVPIGGHNVLEPIALNIPTITGPFFHNFTAINNMLLEAEGLLLANDVEQLVEILSTLLQNPERGQTLVRNAGEILQANQGALQCQLDAILKITNQ